MEHATIIPNQQVIEAYNKAIDISIEMDSYINEINSQTVDTYKYYTGFRLNKINSYGF